MQARWRDLTWSRLPNKVWSEIQEDEVFGRSAQLSYYFLLALIPLLIFLTSAVGLLLGSDVELRLTLFNYLARVMPRSAFQLVDSAFYEVALASGSGKLSFGLLAALWAASNGMSSITQSLNVAFDLRETRPWWKQRLVAIGLTIALSILIISALGLVLYGGHIADGLAARYNLGGLFTFAWRLLQWPITLAVLLLAFGLIYYFAPAAKVQSWVWLTPGAAVAVVLWLLVSFGFRLYLQYFNSYSRTYGSLGAVIILMLWLYFTGAAVLIGGEVNSEIKQGSRRQVH